LATCISLTYLELARAVAPIELDNARVPPQSTATIAGFAEQSIRYAQHATAVAGENLRSAAGDELAYSGVCDEGELAKTLKTNPNIDPENVIEQSYGQALAATLVEASHIAEEAGREA